MLCCNIEFDACLLRVQTNKNSLRLRLLVPHSCRVWAVSTFLDECFKFKHGRNAVATNVIAMNFCLFVLATNMHQMWMRQWCGSKFMPQHNKLFFVDLQSNLLFRFGQEQVIDLFVCQVTVIMVRCTFLQRLQSLTTTNLLCSVCACCLDQALCSIAWLIVFLKKCITKCILDNILVAIIFLLIRTNWIRKCR